MKKQKLNYILYIAALMAIANNACTKEPIPDAIPAQKTAMAPNDTIPPRVPMDVGPVGTMWTAPRKGTITWNWAEWILLNMGINADSVYYYANRPDIDIVTLMSDTLSHQSNYNSCTMWTPYHFHCARDTIQKYWDILEQYGKTVDACNARIYVNKYNGAQLPNVYELIGYVPYGMSEEDSIWYTGKGYRVMRGDFNYKSNNANHYQDKHYNTNRGHQPSDKNAAFNRMKNTRTR